MLRDDLGHPVAPGRPCARVVSLVPSLTEALALARPDAVVGATDWCTHPPGLDVVRVRGTKNPDLAALRALRPDLVVANQEENRERDVRRLRADGVPVWVTRIESVPEAFVSIRRLFVEALGWPVPGWLAEAEREWSGAPAHPAVPVAVPVWRDPWMAVGRDTFTGDLLVRAGGRHVLAGAAQRYPRTSPAELEAAGAAVVLLPDEPYVFSAADGPEAFTVPTRLVPGRLLTWYGPSLLGARRVVRSWLRAAS